MSSQITIGVLALQGGFHEHLNLLRQVPSYFPSTNFTFLEVRTPEALSLCDALIIPGGESTTIANVATQSGLLEPLRTFINVDKKPVWGTCAGLILLSSSATSAKQGGQDLLGGLSVQVRRNHFGRQVDSFFTAMIIPWIEKPEVPFNGVFIRAPVVEEVLSSDVEVLTRLEGKDGVEGQIVAVRQGNVFGTSFHPELTNDVRMHVWWVKSIIG